MWFQNGSKQPEVSRTDLELLKAQFQGLQSEVRAAKLEFAELYDKTYHALKRHDKRIRDAQKAAPEPEPEVPSEREDLMTQRVLARRRGTDAVSPVLPR